MQSRGIATAGNNLARHSATVPASVPTAATATPTPSSSTHAPLRHHVVGEASGRQAQHGDRIAKQEGAFGHGVVRKSGRLCVEVLAHCAIGQVEHDSLAGNAAIGLGRDQVTGAGCAVGDMTDHPKGINVDNHVSGSVQPAIHHVEREELAADVPDRQ